LSRLRTRIREDGNRLYDLADERAATENLLNQRLGLFLIVFAIIIVGVVATDKKIYFLSILFIGAVICWVLAYTIIRLAKKIGILTKEINSFAGASSSKIEKGGGKTARILLGYFVPIFCSTLLFLIFVVGSSGFLDSYLWIDPATVSKVERKVNDVKNDIKEQITPKKDSVAVEFKSVDKVIEESKVIRSKSVTDKFEKEVTKQVTPKTVDRSKNFQNVDAIITPGKISEAGQSVSRRDSSIPQQSQSNVNTDQKNFKNIQSVIVEDQNTKAIQKSTQRSTVPESLKRKQTSDAPPMKGFKDIESVIKK
jgi:hypothetical protein